MTHLALVTPCPFCTDGRFTGNDCTGRARVYRCYECKGSGDALDCDIDNVEDAGRKRAQSVADAEENFDYFANVARTGETGGEPWAANMTREEAIAYAAETVRQQTPALDTMRRELHALRRAWRALARAAKSAG